MKNPQPLLGFGKKDVNVTGNFVLEFNFVTFTSPLNFFYFLEFKNVTGPGRTVPVTPSGYPSRLLALSPALFPG